MSALDDAITWEPIERPPRIILVGTPKIGKSTFAADAPSPIFIPIKGEEGVDDIAQPKLPVVESWDDLGNAFRLLLKEEHSFKTVVIDSSSTLEPIVWGKVCADAKAESIEEVGGGYGKGYTAAAAKWRDIASALDRLRSNGMSSIIIGHVSVGSFKDPMADPYSVYEWTLHKRARATMIEWADVILFAHDKAVTKSTDAGFNKTHNQGMSVGRKLYTQSRPSHPGGGRGVYGRLPYELDLSYAAWQEAVQEQKNKQKESE